MSDLCHLGKVSELVKGVSRARGSWTTVQRPWGRSMPSNSKNPQVLMLPLVVFCKTNQYDLLLRGVFHCIPQQMNNWLTTAHPACAPLSPRTVIVEYLVKLIVSFKWFLTMQVTVIHHSSFCFAWDNFSKISNYLALHFPCLQCNYGYIVPNNSISLCNTHWYWLSFTAPHLFCLFYLWESSPLVMLPFGSCLSFHSGIPYAHHLGWISC